MNEITGKLIVVKSTQKVTDSFQKREFVIETDEQYKQEIQLELHQTYCDLIDSFQIGDNLKIQINVKGRRFEKPLEDPKWFNVLQAWKIEKQ